MKRKIRKTHQELLEILAHAWETLDASELLKYIRNNFKYDSQWVFRTMYSDEYRTYIVKKFQTIRQSGSEIKVSIVKDNASAFDNNMIKLVQNKNHVAYLRIKNKKGKISKMDMCMF